MEILVTIKLLCVPLSWPLLLCFSPTNSIPGETLSLKKRRKMGEEQELEIVNNNIKAERGLLLLNSADPPTFLQEITTSLNKKILSFRQRFCSSSNNSQSKGKLAFSFLQGLFPILEWGRNYKATKFKKDLMAGLTLASLSIPQVLKLIG